MSEHKHSELRYFTFVVFILLVLGYASFTLSDGSITGFVALEEGTEEQQVVAEQVEEPVQAEQAPEQVSEQVEEISAPAEEQESQPTEETIAQEEVQQEVVVIEEEQTEQEVEQQVGEEPAEVIEEVVVEEQVEEEIVQEQPEQEQEVVQEPVPEPVQGQVQEEQEQQEDVVMHDGDIVIVLEEGEEQELIEPEEVQEEVPVQEEVQEEIVEEIVGEIVEEVVLANATEEPEPATNVDDDATLIQLPAEIGKPVRWVKKVTLDKKESKVALTLPKEARNVKVYEKEQGNKKEVTTTRIKVKEEGTYKTIEQTSLITGAVVYEPSKKGGWLRKIGSFFNGITGMVTADPQEHTEMVIDNVQEVEIEYETEAPQVLERNIGLATKQVIVHSPYHYENIITYTEIPEMLDAQKKVKLYWLVNESKIPMQNLTFKDVDGDFLFDTVEWITPHLSNQTFQLEITVLNIQSYPVVGGNWTVMFNTTGTANLTIRAIQGTTWSNTAETEDLKFLQLSCGSQIQSYQWINNEVFIPNYTCNETGYEFSKVLTTGKHHLEFDFGGQKAYANNLASGTPLTTLAFFISSDGFWQSDKGPNAGEDFQESPIQLNDYGETTEKCETWTCSTMTASADDKQNQYCSGGWDCTSFNGVTCETYTCSARTLSGTDKAMKYCSGSWNCASFTNGVCDAWDCDAWSDSSSTIDPYCSSGWSCASFTGGVCDSWSCDAWTQGGTIRYDNYCSGIWDCTSYTGSACNAWDCTAFSEASTSKRDVYCADGWDCLAWDAGGQCDQWQCATPTESGSNEVDFYCSTWNCSVWNQTTKACQSWDCLGGFTQGATSKREYYCDAGWSCTNWELFTYADLINPNVTDMSPSPASSFEVNTAIEIDANVSDDVDVSSVEINVTYPNGTIVTLPLTFQSGNKYNVSFFIPPVIGQYDVVFWANDSSNNINNSETTNFIGTDSVNPNVTGVQPQPAAVFNVSNSIEIAADVVDNVGVNYVQANVTYPNGTNATVQLTFATGNAYNASFVIPNATGTYVVTYWANDTSNNINSSVQTSFSVNDITNPGVTNLIPVNAKVVNTSSTIEIAANVSDDVAVNTVVAVITYPNATVQNLSLTSQVLPRYNESFVVPALEGIYTVNIFANDSSNNINFSESTTFNATIPPLDCGQTITENTNITAPLTGSGTCLTVTAPITITCQNGANLTGDGTGSGILIQNTNGVTVRDCVISTFSKGISASGSRDIEIINNTILQHGSAGIEFGTTNDSLVLNNTVHSGVSANFPNDIYIVQGGHNSVVGNNIITEYAGVFLSGTSNSSTQENVIHSGGGSFALGVYALSSSMVNVTDNYLNLTSPNTYGIYVYQTDKGIVERNTVHTLISAAYSVTLYDSDGFNMSHNYLNTNGTFGLYLYAALDNILENNTVRAISPSGYGVYETSSARNQVINNDILITGAAGIGLRSGFNANDTYRSNKFNATNGKELSFDSSITGSSFHDNLLLGTVNFSSSQLNNVDIDINESPVADPSGLINLSDYLTISGSGYIDFNVSYDDSEITEIDENSIRFYRYNGTGYEVVVNSTVDTTNNVISSGNLTSSFFGDIGSFGNSSAVAIALSLSNSLSGNINWTVVSVPSYNLSANGNNGTGITEYDVAVSVSGTTVDMYIKASGNLSTGGGEQLGLENEKFSYNISDNTVPSDIKFNLTTNYSDNQIGDNLANGSMVYLKFFLDVPPGQAPGTYGNNVSIIGVEDGAAP